MAIHVAKVPVGPLALAPFKDGYLRVLRTNGYASKSIELHSFLLADLSGWMDERELGVPDLSRDVVEDYFTTRRARRS